MSDYLIGDVQGCYDALQILLKKSHFSLDKDRLFFLGDVVNRGNKSLETLRFIRNLGDNAKMLLGNHDFHLLACALGDKTPSNKDTFNDILNAKVQALMVYRHLSIAFKSSAQVYGWSPYIILIKSPA
jgi:bis(5'-nucleosyl)-tetraphosphatase (symmetrical)